MAAALSCGFLALGIEIFVRSASFQIRSKIALELCTVNLSGTIKKTLPVLCGLLSLHAFEACADNDRAIAVSQLPAAAQRFIESFGPVVEVAYALREREFFEVEYKVVLTNGVRMKFRRNGTWKRIDCRYGPAPRQVVPPQVARRIGELYPGARIMGIERDERTTKIRLDNRATLTFDRHWNFEPAAAGELKRP